MCQTQILKGKNINLYYNDHDGPQTKAVRTRMRHVLIDGVKIMF